MSKAQKFKDDIDKLMAEAMPGIAPIKSNNVKDAELLSAVIERFASHLGVAIAFAHQGDSAKIEQTIEGTVAYIYESVAHFAKIKSNVAKLKPYNEDGTPYTGGDY
jgi:hypothetical protein